jgi:hypothetical protein
MRRRALATALLLAASASLSRPPEAADTPAVKPPVEIRTTVEPNEVTIGTPFRYTIEVVPEKDVEVFVPLLSDRHGEFVVADFGQEPVSTGEGVRYWYSLVGYDVGPQFVPGPSIGYRAPGTEIAQIEAPKVLVKLTSLLARENAPHELRDIKGPVDLPADYRWVWAAVALIAVVALLAAGLARLFGGGRRGQAVPERPAHEIALEALARLRGARLFEAGQFEQYYVRLSSIVREYLEARFLLRAPEMTTEEFLAIAQRSPQLIATQRSALGQFLGEADLVKFARHVPRSTDADRAYAAAREFVEATAPAPVVKG